MARQKMEGLLGGIELMSEQPEENKPGRPLGKTVAIYSRIASVLFLAIFILGISMMFGEGSQAAKIPFSSLSITTTMFGALGWVMSELTARRAEKWHD
jgi:multisubunit Na+/H+ antiporter MnhB subunit